MRKVGIITYFTPDNYGAVLQAYALQTAIRSCGYDVEIINYVCKARNPRKVRFPRRPLRILKFLLDWVVARQKEERKKEGFRRFRAKYLRCTSRYMKTNEIPCENYDVVVVGSDQVWNPNINEQDSAYWLSFVPDFVRKVSYAPSFGMAQLTSAQILEYSAYLKRFQFVSCRENDGVDLLRAKFGRSDAVKTLDPTLLLDADSYSQCMENVENASGRFVYCYYVGHISKRNALIAIARRRAKELHANLVVASNEVKTLDLINIKYENPSPGEFLSLVNSAVSVVTNSFHGTVFSILFKKDVIAYTGAGRENRFSGLLDPLGISDRLIAEYSKDRALPKFEGIDYSLVRRNLLALRSYSWNYLRTSLQEGTIQSLGNLES